MSTKLKYPEPYKPVKYLIQPARRRWRNEGKNRCVVCGRIGETTDDHVPPQALYSYRELNHEVVTVPACNVCQDTPDREFCDFMTMLVMTKSGTPEAKRKVDQIIHKIRKKDKKYRREIVDVINKAGIYEKMMVSPFSGLYQPELMFKLPTLAINPTLVKMIHGYFWLLTGGKILSDIPGKIYFNEVDYHSRANRGLVGNQYRTLVYEDDIFILTHHQGKLSDEQTEDHVYTMGLHFYGDVNDCRKGAGVQVFIVLDYMLSNENAVRYRDELEKKCISYSNNASPQAVYDLCMKSSQ